MTYGQLILSTREHPLPSPPPVPVVMPVLSSSPWCAGKLISSTEVPAFIMRDDMMDQMYKWAVIEAGEGGFR